MRHLVSGPSSEALTEITRYLLEAKAPAIVIGDDVARARAGGAVAALSDVLGAPIWVEMIHNQQAVASDHPNFRGALPGVATAISEAFGDADTVLMIGGPFFEEANILHQRMIFSRNSAMKP